MKCSISSYFDIANVKTSLQLWAQLCLCNVLKLNISKPYLRCFCHQLLTKWIATAMSFELMVIINISHNEVFTLGISKYDNVV